jgi:acyl-CoA thioesterase FadM
VEYLKPVKVDEDLIVEGHEVEKSGRNMILAGEIRNQSGQVLARGRGRFVIIGATEPREKHTADIAGANKSS